MTGTRQSGVSAETILAIHDEAAALPIVLSGVLDAKIAETRAVIADLATRQGIVQTMEEAKKVRDAATALHNEGDEQLKAAAAKCDELLSTAKARLAAADARATEAEQAAKQVSIQSADLEKRRKANDADFAKMREGIKSRQDGLDAQAAEQDKREAQLKADRKALNDRIDSLKMTV